MHLMRLVLRNASLARDSPVHGSLLIWHVHAGINAVLSSLVKVEDLPSSWASNPPRAWPGRRKAPRDVIQICALSFG